MYKMFDFLVIYVGQRFLNIAKCDLKQMYSDGDSIILFQNQIIKASCKQIFGYLAIYIGQRFLNIVKSDLNDHSIVIAQNWIIKA